MSDDIRLKNETDISDLTLFTIFKEFSNEDNARAFVESLLWPDGPVCPHCQSTEAYRITPKPGSKTRRGLLKCKACRKQFTVTVGTIFEDSHIALSKWVIAIHLFCASKKGISAHQIHRMLKVTIKTAWFLMHRIRWAVAGDPEPSKMTGVVEADEVWFGGKAKNMHAKKRRQMLGGGRGTAGKVPVMTLVERDGRVKTTAICNVNEKNLKQVLDNHVDDSAHLMTDEHRAYLPLSDRFASHTAVNHSGGEYVRKPAQGHLAHVNSAESVHALLKRGVYGTYHHWSERHLHRYLSEFDFRWNLRKASDGQRTMSAILHTPGKRLKYKQPSSTGKEV
jgi:transposase-like protein